MLQCQEFAFVRRIEWTADAANGIAGVHFEVWRCEGGVMDMCWDMEHVDTHDRSEQALARATTLNKGILEASGY